jgi:hypothetical protein
MPWKLQEADPERQRKCGGLAHSGGVAEERI